MEALPTTPDRRKTYYKMTNINECHRELQYYDGLVVDPVEFNDNPKASCVEGGIYFTTKKYLHRFFGYGEIVRPIKIPSDAKVVLDPMGDKYRADRLFFLPKKDMGFYFDRLFDKRTIPKDYYWCLVSRYPDYFDKWFDKETFPKKEYWRLITHCPEHFDEWFDKNIFPKVEYWRLTERYSDNFDKWFDKETFPKKYYYYLAAHCYDHFDKWFDKRTFPKEQYWSIVERYSNLFHKWFDKRTFPKEHYWHLAKYCQKYKHIWNKEL